MKLANSAYFGMRGRVTTLQFAVTVVGFRTVRTMATVALADLEDETRLPEDFWSVSTSLALAAASLAPRFGERPADALCLGLLAQLGSALLYQNDCDGYRELLGARPTFARQRSAELRRYGFTAVELTSMALEKWGFPLAMVVPLRKVDDRTSPAGGLVRASYEIVARLTITDYEPVPVGRLTSGTVREDELPPVLHHVRSEAQGLQRFIIGS
jgi:HD-like signal output (HDOD) protein